MTATSCVKCLKTSVNDSRDNLYEMLCRVQYVRAVDCGHSWTVGVGGCTCRARKKNLGVIYGGKVTEFQLHLVDIISQHITASQERGQYNIAVLRVN